MKFAVGDIAKVRRCHDPDPLIGWYVGASLVITSVGPVHCYKRGVPAIADYRVTLSTGMLIACNEWCLLPGDSIPASILAIFSKKQPNPDKVKETVK